VQAQDGVDPNSDPLIPIYARLGVVEGTELTDQMKQGLNEIAPLVAAGQHRKVVERLRTFGIGLSYSYVELRPNVVSKQVASALKALDNSDNAAADKALKLAEKSLLVETINVGLETTAPAAAAATPSEPATASATTGEKTDG